MRHCVIALAAAGLLAGAAPAAAAPCKSSKGKFAKCGAPGATPAQGRPAISSGRWPGAS